jgi:hypothetical protein
MLVFLPLGFVEVQGLVLEQKILFKINLARYYIPRLYILNLIQFDFVLF